MFDLSPPRSLLLLLATPALAQGGRLIYHDDAGRLDRSRVQSAAQPLINRGATVAMYAENTGGAAAFQQRLEQDGLANGSSIRPDVIAIFVSLQIATARFASAISGTRRLRPTTTTSRFARTSSTPA